MTIAPIKSDKKVLQERVFSTLYKEWVIDHKENPFTTVSFRYARKKDEVLIVNRDEEFLAIVPIGWVREQFDIPLTQLLEIF